MLSFEEYNFPQHLIQFYLHLTKKKVFSSLYLDFHLHSDMVEKIVLHYEDHWHVNSKKRVGPKPTPVVHHIQDFVL